MRRSVFARAAGTLLGCACACILSSIPACSPIKVQSSPTRAAASEPVTVVLESPPPQQPAPPPLSLTASDGTGLRLVSLTARAVVEAPLAYTELRLVFENPEDRVLEGTFRMALPERASIGRFAMRIGELWQEGEIVARERAREAYEDFLHRRQDPALLEQAAGNEFSARVFPIPARDTKELILSYSQEIPGDAPFLLPLRGLPELGEIDVAVTPAEGGPPLGELKEQRFQPAADFSVNVTGARAAQGSGLRSGNLVLARVKPMPGSSPDPILSAVVLMDTSASRAAGFRDQVRLLENTVRRIAATAGPKTPLLVACYDQSTDVLFEGEAGAFGAAEVGKVLARRALGASNFAGALEWVHKKAKARNAKRLILISDGVATAGPTEADEIRAAAAGLKLAGIERIDAIAVGGIRDAALLRHVTSAGLARDGIVADGATDTADLVRRISEATRSGIAVKVDGARWVYPAVLDGVAAPPLELREVEKPLLQRSFARAKIESLLERQAKEGQDARIAQEIIGLSMSHRVLSPYTSLLVLETEADYKRFKIDRRALSDILTVEDGRLAVLKRSEVKESKKGLAKREAEVAQAAAPAPVTAPATANAPAADPPVALPQQAETAVDPLNASGSMMGDPIADAYGPSGPSDAGKGEARSATASGRGRIAGRAHRVRPPQIRMGATTVSGRLPPETIQWIVRLNFNRFKACYEAGLRANPKLAGRVAVKFTLERSGELTDVSVAETNLPDPAVVECVRQTFATLSFPQPEGGYVVVTYPIVFSPADAAGANPPGAREPGAVSAGLGTVNRPRVQIPKPPPREEPPAATPFEGEFKEITDRIGAGNAKAALDRAWAWRDQAPGDVMALVALGEAMEALGDIDGAARSYGSIIDLFPARADLRRFAGGRLERLRGSAGLDLAVDTYKKAVADRPDHPSSHRMLAMAWLKKGAYSQAFEAARAGLARQYPPDRFAGAKRILAEDLGLIAAAWKKTEPARSDIIAERLRAAGGTPEDGPSLRFVLTWETDANDVDFHIYDAEGGHAYFAVRDLSRGGSLYEDVRTGYGPECFTVRGPADLRSKGYTLRAHYYSRGPMGYGMGKLQVIDHDGKGGITFEERPFVAMTDGAYVNLGTVAR